MSPSNATNATITAASSGLWGGSLKANFKYPIAKPSDNEISWQSAMWPVVACIFAVMTQNSGRVLELSPEIGTVLRASPLCCLADVLMIILEFMCILISGCPISRAARHIWYSRFSQISYKVERSRVESAWDDVREWTSRDEEQTTLEQNDKPQSNTAGAPSHSISTDVSSASSPGPSTDFTIQARPFKEHGLCTGDNHEQNFSSPCTICSETLESPVLSPSPSIAASPDRRPVSIEDFSSLRVYTSMQDALDHTWVHITYFSGSEIDRTWRLSICSFIFGALPQIIKVASMRGIPWTQAFVSAYTLSFVVPEIFRLVAGKAGATNLIPSTLSPRVEWVLMAIKMLLAAASILCSLIYYCWYISMALAFAFQGYLLHPVVMSLACTLAFILSRLLTWIATRMGWIWPLDFGPCRPNYTGTILERANTIHSTYTTAVNEVFALDTASMSLRLPVNYALFLPLSLGFTVLLYLDLPIFEPIFLLVKIVLYLGINSYYIVASFAIFGLLFLIHRALFVGSLSRIPRRLTGMEGTMSEFFCGYFLFVAIVGTFCGYAYDGWDPVGTFKPTWAENLG